MQITIHDTNDLTAADIRVLQVLIGSETPEKAPKPQSKPEPALKAEKAVEPAPEPDENGEATMKDAVELATKLVSNGEAAKVKAALAEVGAKRVSQLKEDKIPTFVASLS